VEGLPKQNELRMSDVLSRNLGESRSTFSRSRPILPSYRPGRPFVARAALAIVAMALAFVPVILVTGLNIWVPTAMVQEVFGVSYASLRLMQLGFFLVPVGHAFTLLISYPSRILADTVVSGSDDYIRYQAFGLSVYVIYGLTIFGLLALALRSRLSLTDCTLLLFVAFSKTLTMRMTEIGLTIDYDRLVTILYVALALVWMLRIKVADGYHATVKHSVVLGSFMGIAIGTKLTLGAIFLPFVLPLVISQSMPRLNRNRVWRLAVFGLSTLASFTSVILAYVLFRWDYLVRFGIGSFARFSDDALVHQSSPFLWDELRRWLDPGSYYFGLQCLATLSLILIVLLARDCWHHRDRFSAEFLTACVISGLVLAYEVARRTSGNSLLDCAAWIAFVNGVSGALLLHRAQRAIAGRWIVASLSVVCVTALVLQNPVQILQRLRVNSELAHAIQNRIELAGDLPHVYYMDDSSQPLLFPSVDLSVVTTSATSADGHDAFVKRYHQRALWASPANGVVHASHLMIVPEYVDTLPDTPANRREWPDMFPRVAVFDTSPELAGVLQNPGNTCTRYQFVAQDSTHLHSFYGYATRVTVCLLIQR
jgi:hypothetical protein